MAKEALERENYKQATMLNEKEDHIRGLIQELRQHEQRLFEIQSMFNTGAVGNQLNMSCANTENQMQMHQRQISQNPGQGLHYIAQSLNNFSPRNFGGGLTMNGPLRLGGQAHGVVNQSMQLPHLNANHSFVSQLNPVEGGIIYNQKPLQGKVECAHCLQQIDSFNFHSHLQSEHPELLAANQEPQQMIYHRDQPIAQSICLSSRSQNNFDQMNAILCQTPQQLQNIYNQPQPLKIVTQTSPRMNNPNKFISNSKSFNCLLQEINEDEEKNVVGSMVHKTSKLGRPPQSNVYQEEEIHLVGVTGLLSESDNAQSTGLRKSRNHQSTNNLKATGSSSVVIATGNTLTQKPSSTSIHSQLPKQEVSQKESNSSVKSGIPKKQESDDKKSFKRDKSSTNITNEIKDLLDKLVAYQGGSNHNNSQAHHHQNALSQQIMPQHSQSVALACGQYTQRMQKKNTESMVELRSSISSSRYNGDNNKAEMKPPQTAREQKQPQMVSTSVQVKEGQRKQWAKPQMSYDNNIPRDKSKAKEVKPNISKKVNQFELAENLSNNSPQRQHSSDEDRHSSTSPRSSIDRETAKHTSKDTLMTIPGHKKRGRGRRYHEVNKSDVITPNSPRRYQDYFKNRLHPIVSGADSQHHSAGMQIGGQKQNQMKHASKPKADKKPKKAADQQNQNYYNQNHRYSPSNTKSMVDESQYNQLSPSPEKPKAKLNMNDESHCFALNSSNPYQLQQNTSNMPLQTQLQNQLFIGGKSSSNAYRGKGQFGTYDSGTVLIGAASDAIFKTQGTGSHVNATQQNLMFGGAGFGFAPNSTLSTIKTGNQKAIHHFENANVINCSLDDDSDIRPSQIDEFLEVRAKQQLQQQEPQQNNIPQNITSSYITIGDDDPFLTGRFCDATTKQFNFKANSHNPSKIHPSIPMSKNSDMQSYNQAARKL